MGSNNGRAKRKVRALPTRFYFSLSLIFLALISDAKPSQGRAAQARSPVIGVAGKEEVVFDWTRQRCEEYDYPDLAARAFRDANGKVQLIASHFVVRRASGETLDSVKHDCKVVMRSARNADPTMYNDAEWIAGLYTEDGKTVYATVHNEYQGHLHPGKCPSRQYFKCWYNVLTLAVSTDGGVSFQDAVKPPGHLVASLPYPYTPDGGPYGIFEGSNIIKGKDGLYYEFIKIEARDHKQWACLMRTDNLSDPKSWRAWDGKDFTIRFINPYVDNVASPDQHLCAPISFKEIENMHQSITYNTFLNRYIMVDAVGKYINNVVVYGIYYALSDDLIHWTDRQLLFASPLGALPPDPKRATAIAYPSILDPDSPSRNFETSDEHAYLYYTRFHLSSGNLTSDRDLVRIPIRFFRSEDEKAAALAPRISMKAEQGNSGIELSGALTDPDGKPIGKATLDLEATRADVSGNVYIFTLSGTVPDNAQQAQVGYRLNMECNCAASSELFLYNSSYTEADETTNRVPESTFVNGLNSWGALGGSVRPTIESSNKGSGKMLHLKLSDKQQSGLNSSIFDVSKSKSYTVTFTARVMPGSQGGGYFTLIFLSGRKEIERKQIPLTPNAYPLGSVTTDQQGNFKLAVSTFPENTNAVVVLFKGDESRPPTSFILVR